MAFASKRADRLRAKTQAGNRARMVPTTGPTKQARMNRPGSRGSFVRTSTAKTAKPFVSKTVGSTAAKAGMKMRTKVGIGFAAGTAAVASIHNSKGRGARRRGV